MSDLVYNLRAIAKDKAASTNFARASYCAGRAGCDDIKDLRSKPEDYIEWKAADKIEQLERKIKNGQ